MIVLKALKFVWKNTRVWVLVTCITMVVLLTATLIATQNLFLRNTISTAMGGERQVLQSGDPTPFIRYTADNKGFKQYKTDSEFNSKKETLSEAEKFNEQIVEEGIVLLKNNAKALPLAQGAKVSVFGKNSVNFVLGGSGSSAGSGGGTSVLYDSLEHANFKINPTLKAFYNNRNQSGAGRPKNPEIENSGFWGFPTGETPQSKYSDTVKNSYNEYNDAALVVISRIGGEGFDLPRTMKTSFNGGSVSGAGNPNDHYLQLDKNEKALLAEVCAKFDKVVVLINCSTSMELGFLDDGKYDIDAALWVGSPGSAVDAIGKVISGEVNPSGRLFDTFARDFTKDPTYQNFGKYNKVDGNEYLSSDGKGGDAYFVEYQEGIYVGYRYYETRAYEEKVSGKDPAWWEKNVVYPLGYGLSYTSFEWEITDDGGSGRSLTKDDTIEIKVKVTNTGDVAGKDVVQLYYSAPYYDGIEKAHVVLGDFAKTQILAKGESEIVTLSLTAFDMASYDYSNANRDRARFKGYELEDGPYDIFIGRNAHDAWADEDGLSAFFVVDHALQYDKDPATDNKIENRFDDVSNHITDAGRRYMSRLDFENTFPAPLTDEERTMSVDFFNSLYFFGWDEAKKAPKGLSEEFDSDKKWHSTESYNQGVKNDLMLYDLIGTDGTVDYEDARWDTILDQITIEEMSLMIGIGNFNTRQIGSIGKPRTTDPDSPSGFVNFIGDPSVYDTCFYASGCLIAATYNRDLAFDFGVMIGIEGITGDVKGDGRPYSGWYAPACNIHRTPFSGRNFEYYSEDGFLSGVIAANTVLGARSKGVYPYIKHFAVNDQETDRDTFGLVTWLNEQAMREIYLKPFEIAVKVGKVTGVMSSFNRIGTVWAGGSYELLTEVLRDEWGFRGMIVSDFNLSAFMDVNQMIRAGGDINLTPNGQPAGGDALTLTQKAAMRRATKNILYTVAQSNAMNGKGPGVVYRYAMPLWVIGLILANVAALVIFATWGFFAIRKALKKK